MSAFIVNDFHINSLVSWASSQNGCGRVSYYWLGQRRWIQGQEERIARLLHAENARSVGYRYAGKVLDPVFDYQCQGQVMAPVQVIRAVHCLEYQSCECDDWEQTEACAVLRGFMDAAVRTLPGYEQASWELFNKEVV